MRVERIGPGRPAPDHRLSYAVADHRLSYAVPAVGVRLAGHGSLGGDGRTGWPNSAVSSGGWPDLTVPRRP
ncbi:hypothetical protein DSC45_12690 [Streptomyces sp. YIM 130001]|nr:hypothetical protein DSC45_12690 [Streptomyces sp. YIM 130001]